MTLREFVNNPDLMAQYKRHKGEDWFILLMSACLETLCEPMMPRDLGLLPTDRTVSLLHGENAGAWKVYKTLRDLEEMIERNPELLDETYGVTPEVENAEQEDEDDG